MVYREVDRQFPDRDMPHACVLAFNTGFSELVAGYSERDECHILAEGLCYVGEEIEGERE